MMRALSLHRPYAGLVAENVKWIETRSWRTRHVGDLAIGSAGQCADDDDEIWAHPQVESSMMTEPRSIVAVVSVVACLPMVAAAPGQNVPEDCIALTATDARMYRRGRRAVSVIDQVPFGDFRPGGFGYVLDAVRKLAQPIPCPGRQGIWQLPDDIEADVRAQLS